MMSCIRRRIWKKNGVRQTAWQLDYRDTAGGDPEILVGLTNEFRKLEGKS